MPLLRAWARTPSAGSDRAARLALAGLVSRMSTLRQMSIAIASELLSGRDLAVEAAMVKDLGTQLESDVVDVVRRFALVEPDPGRDEFSALLATAILHTPVFTLRGGTSEMLRSIVAKGLAG
jgi:hypothetical protein